MSIGGDLPPTPLPHGELLPGMRSARPVLLMQAMRIRQVKPSWFTDKALQTGVRADTREFYIGLWMLADDDGWFEWDEDAIGVAIYGFLPLARREHLIAKHTLALMELTPTAPHLLMHPCGHSQVPKMPQHQRVSEMKRVMTDHKRHTEGKCPIPTGPRGAPRVPEAPPVGSGNGKRNGTELVNARERDPENVTEFASRVPRPA